MANDTMTIKVGDIGKVLMCKRILKNQTSDTGEVPFYKISTFGAEATTFVSKEIYEEYKLKYSYPKKGDILISAAGTVGKTVIFDGEPGYFQDSNIVWVDNDEKVVINKYLYYYYQTSPWRTSNGSTITRIYNDDLRNMEISYPSIANQRNIARVLQTLDDKIALNNKINAELEQTARLIYDYWFTQFDFPDAQGKPYKSSGGAMVYNDQLKRKIPAHWHVTSLRELIAVSKNGDWGKSENGSGHIKTYCVRGADINGLNGLTGFDPPVRYIESSHANRTLKSDDLVVEISGGSPTQSTGRMAHISKDVIDRLQGDVVCSNFCKAISLKNERLSYVVNHYWNHLYESGTFFNFEGKTSGIKNLMFDQLVIDVKLALPGDSALIDKYYALAKAMDSQKQANLSQNEELVRLRDWLLPMLMTGQVKVE